MPPRLVLHIGTEKTGTTSIQESLARNRQKLAELGYCHPVSPGPTNHVWLAMLAGQDRLVADLAGFLGAPVPELGLARAEFRRAFQAEMAALPASVHTVVLSNEHCHGRLVRSEEIGELKRFLAPHFREVEVWLYLRRQDRLAVSHYSTKLRGNFTAERIFPKIHPSAWYYNYFELVSAWAGVFGRDAMRLRVYERRELLGQDVAVDFLAHLGIEDPAALFGLAREANTALSALGQTVLLEFNKRAARSGEAPDQLQRTLRPTRHRLANELGRRLKGPPRLPARAEAEAFLATYAEANERLRRAFLPDRSALFDGDFSGYPAEETEVDGDRLVLARLLADMLVEAAAEAQAARARSAGLAARALRELHGGNLDGAQGLLQTLAGEAPPPA